MENKQQIFLCRCENLGHIVRVSYFPGDADGVFFSVSVYQYKTFWERLKASVRFLFLKRQTAEFDSTLLSNEDTKRMRVFLDDYLKDLK